jgi:hypothetical protein
MARHTTTIAVVGILGVTCLVIAVAIVIMLVANHKPSVPDVTNQQRSTASGATQVTTGATQVTTTWPSTAATDAKSVRLREILKVIKDSHPLSVDPADEWSLVDGGGGIAYVLRNKGDMSAKLTSFAEVWRRGKALINNMSRPEIAAFGKVKPAQLALLKNFFASAKKYGVCPNIEIDRDLRTDKHSAFSTRTSSSMPLTFAAYPLGEENPKFSQKWQSINAPNPAMSNRFDSFVHELSHVGCGGTASCKSNAGHGPDQARLAASLSRISHMLGLRTFNPRWTCPAKECGNCGTWDKPSDPCDPVFPNI